MRPMGKPKQGFEKRYKELFEMIETDNIPKPSFLERIRGVKYPTKEALLEEWFENQITTYETIKAPKGGRDKEADVWIRNEYEKLEDKPPIEEYLKDYEGFYVIELAKHQDAVPVYTALEQDENVFRGQFLRDCVDLIGEELVNEAWNSKLAEETLDYGNRLMQIADTKGKEHNLEYLKEQRLPTNDNEDSIESKLHVVYSLAKWLIFYGKNGHGYEADF